jgi:hypothetical protein
LWRWSCWENLMNFRGFRDSFNLEPKILILIKNDTDLRNKKSLVPCLMNIKFIFI